MFVTALVPNRVKSSESNNQSILLLINSILNNPILPSSAERLSQPIHTITSDGNTGKEKKEDQPTRKRQDDLRSNIIDNTGG